MLEDGLCVESFLDAETLRDSTSVAEDCVEHSRPGDTFGTRFMIKGLAEEQPETSQIMTSTVVCITECNVLVLPVEEIRRLPKFSAVAASRSASRATNRSCSPD